jgi:hypothetical protein
VGPGQSYTQPAYRPLATDASGNIFVTGYFQGTVDFGGGPLTATGRDIFVLKLDPSGTLLWSKHFAGSSQAFAYALATNASGNVLLTGYFEGTIDFGGGALTSVSATDPDVFVLELDATGQHVWSRRFGATGQDFGTGLAVDTAGNVLLTGFSSNGGIDFGGGALTGNGVFVAKLDASGGHVWSKLFNQQNIGVTGLATDGAGSVFLTGTFGQSVNFGGGALLSFGGVDVFLVKFNSSGTHVWSKNFGGANDAVLAGQGRGGQYGMAVATDPGGNVIITGYFDSPVDFGGGPLAVSGASDVFVAKFNGAGSLLWGERFGDASNNPQTGTSVATDAAAHVFVAGTFAGTIDFGNGALTASANLDGFVVKLAP